MLARISFRQVPLAARVYARSYTSSVREGSVAASKEFGYAFTAFFWTMTTNHVCSKKEKAHEGMCSRHTSLTGIGVDHSMQTSI
jgi:hypothetical protein